MTDKQPVEGMTLAPGVVDTIISIIVNEQEGVASLGSSPASGIFAKLSNKPSTSGIESRYNDEGKLDIVLHIEVKYGYVLPDLADKLRQAVSDALIVQVGVQVGSIDIYVDGIQFDQN